jgi:DNA-binding MarR family transcriptional regulator
MSEATVSTEKRLLHLFSRLRKLAFGQNPLENSSVTMPQLALLDWIAASPGCGLQEIADGMDVTAPTASVSVRRLEQAGLVERQPDPEDGRAIQVYLSPKGRRLHEQALSFRRKKMRRLLHGLTADEQDVLLRLLTKAISTAEEESETSSEKEIGQERKLEK